MMIYGSLNLISWVFSIFKAPGFGVVDGTVRYSFVYGLGLIGRLRLVVRWSWVVRWSRAVGWSRVVGWCRVMRTVGTVGGVMTAVADGAMGAYISRCNGDNSQRYH